MRQEELPALVTSIAWNCARSASPPREAEGPPRRFHDVVELPVPADVDEVRRDLPRVAHLPIHERLLTLAVGGGLRELQQSPELSWPHRRFDLPEVGNVDPRWRSHIRELRSGHRRVARAEQSRQVVEFQARHVVSST